MGISKTMKTLPEIIRPLHNPLPCRIWCNYAVAFPCTWFFFLFRKS